MKKNKKKNLYLLFVFVLFFFFVSNFLFSQEDIFDSNDFSKNIANSDEGLIDSWFVYHTFNFEIYYYNESAIKDVIYNIDRAYLFIIQDLDYFFYFSPKKIKIYIYKTQKDYLKKTKINCWAGGHADSKKNIIYTFEQKNLMRDVLVHELTHLVFDNYMGYPRSMNINWLHEGLAVYEDKRFSNKKWDIKKLTKNQLPHLRDVFKYSTGLEENDKNISIWYMQVGTVIAYLLSLDRSGFKIFCENLKIYKNPDMALSSTYPWDFKNVDELDKNWRKWLCKQKDSI
jgi:hypothetical protein